MLICQMVHARTHTYMMQIDDTYLSFVN